MINLTKGNTEDVYFTGTEKATISAPYFLFAFTNRTTDEVVKWMATNTSTSGRYDKASLVVNTYFDTKEEGLWKYEVYQKASNSDMNLTGVIVESGYMFLRPSAPFAPTKYSNQDNTFVTYGE
jgi:hypothetical protein